MCHLSQVTRQHSGLRYKEDVVMKLHLSHLGKSSKNILAKSTQMYLNDRD